MKVFTYLLSIKYCCNDYTLLLGTIAPFSNKIIAVFQKPLLFKAKVRGDSLKLLVILMLSVYTLIIAFTVYIYPQYEASMRAVFPLASLCSKSTV